MGQSNYQLLLPRRFLRPRPLTSSPPAWANSRFYLLFHSRVALRLTLEFGRGKGKYPPDLGNTKDKLEAKMPSTRAAAFNQRNAW